MNILDLGYFNSIQGLQYKKECETVNDLVSNVLKYYEELEYRKLLNVWITLQLVMLSILRVKGDNTYQLTHINKIKLEQEGKLRTELLVNESILEIVDGFKIDKPGNDNEILPTGYTFTK